MERLNSFLRIVSENKIWVITTSLVSLAIPFAGNYILTVPAEYTELAHFQIQIQNNLEEQKRVDLVFQTVKETSEEVGGVFSFYQENFGGKPIMQEYTANTIEQGLNGVSNARNMINLAIGTLRGVQLANENLDLYRKEFGVAMSELDKDIAVFEQFYVAQTFHNSDKVREMLPSLREADKHSQQISTQLIASIDTFSDKFISDIQTQTVDIAERTNTMRMLEIRRWVCIACLVYVGAYIVGVIVAFARFSNRKQPSSIILPK